MAALDLDAMWDFAKPAESEARFRAALAKVNGDDALILRTQIARTYEPARHASTKRTASSTSSSRCCPARRAPSRACATLLERGRTLRSASSRCRRGRCSCWRSRPPTRPAELEGSPPTRCTWSRWSSRASKASSSGTAHGRLRARGQRSEGARLGGARAEQHRRDPQRSRPPRRGADACCGRRSGARAAGKPGPIRVARWMVANTLRRLQRNDEALAMQLELEREWDAAGDTDPYVYEELALLYAAKGDSRAARRSIATSTSAPVEAAPRAGVCRAADATTEQRDGADRVPPVGQGAARELAVLEAVRPGDTLYLSGQIGVVPGTLALGAGRHRGRGPADDAEHPRHARSACAGDEPHRQVQRDARRRGRCGRIRRGLPRLLRARRAAGAQRVRLQRVGARRSRRGRVHRGASSGVRLRTAAPKERSLPPCGRAKRKGGQVSGDRYDALYRGFRWHVPARLQHRRGLLRPLGARDARRGGDPLRATTTARERPSATAICRRGQPARQRAAPPRRGARRPRRDRHAAALRDRDGAHRGAISSARWRCRCRCCSAPRRCEYRLQRQRRARGDRRRERDRQRARGARRVPGARARRRGRRLPAGRGASTGIALLARESRRLRCRRARAPTTRRC